MAVLAVQRITRAGLAPAYSAAAGGGDKFSPTDRTFLHVKNGGGSPITATVVTPKQTSYGAAIADIAVSVPAAGERMIGPFPRQHFADTDDALADITYSAVTSVTVAVVELSD